MPTLTRLSLLLGRVHHAFPECRLSLSLCVEWCRELVGAHHRWSHDAHEVDQPLERLSPEINRALANDAPALRAKIRRALRQVHRNAQALAKKIENG
jgi:hypothetical protein